MKLLTLALLAITAAHADSYQSQSNSNGVMTQSSSSDSKTSEADYSKWPNGGGKVHKLAHVDKSAEIDAESKVGPYVRIAAGAAIRKSLLNGSSASRQASVGKGVLVEGSTLQGAFNLRDKAVIQNSMLQGPFEVAAKVTLSKCQLSGLDGEKPFVIKSDMSGEMKMYPGQ